MTTRKRTTARARESNKAKQAFEDYFLLGPGRSFSSLLEQYRTQSVPKACPTLRLPTLKRWSTKHNWQERIAGRGAEVAQAALEKIKETATQNGYAVFQKRIYDLNRLAELLLEEVGTEDKRWLPDVKQIGSGDDFERVDIVRFNAPLIEQFRKTLDDIAAEMGERVKKVELSLGLDVSRLSDEELRRLADGGDPTTVLTG